MKHEDGCCEKERACLCSVKGVLNTISKKWAICIVSLLGAKEEGYHFNELQRKLNGISPKSLSDRLKELQEEGFVHREVTAETPPKVIYTLTDDGKDVRNALLPLVSWVREREERDSSPNTDTD